MCRPNNATPLRGYDLRHGASQQKLAVATGVWPVYRFDPRRIADGLPPLQLDCGPPTARVKTYMENEGRFRMVERLDRKRFEQLAAAAQREATQRFAVHQQLAGVTVPAADDEG